MNKSKNYQQGFAHLALILGVLTVIVVGALAYTRVRDSNNASLHSQDVESTEQIATLPENLTDIKSLEELEQIVGVDSSTNIIKFVLENEGDTSVYKVVLSNGRKLVINATTGAIISEEMVDVSDDDKIPAGLKITVTPAQAYSLAAARSSSPVKSIELEVEDKKIVYKIEFKDGSKVEINAVDGSVIKAEVKDESDEDSEDEEEDEDHAEDENENEDSDDDEDEEDQEDDEDR